MRRCWLWLVLGVGLLVGFLLIVLSWKRGHNEIIGPPLLKTDGTQLKDTLISPHLETSIPPGKNVLWCSTFQLVWNEGCRYAGGDIHMKDEPPMVVALNKKVGNEKDVEADSCLVMSGLVEDGIVEKIRKELDWKFQGQADPDILRNIEPRLPTQGWAAFAYIFRSLPFEYAFKRLPEPLTFGAAKVTSFGLKNGGGRWDDIQIARQVTILDYKSDDDFILALKPKDKSEQIILAKIAPVETLQRTIETVRLRIASSGLKPCDKPLELGESVVVPVLNFELLQEYGKLNGKQIITPGRLNGIPIVLAIQSIRFRLDEYGAILKSEAAMAAKAAESGLPRQLIFDKPFLILLERRDAKLPYFALWVDNPELLAPFK